MLSNESLNCNSDRNSLIFNVKDKVEAQKFQNLVNRFSSSSQTRTERASAVRGCSNTPLTPRTQKKRALQKLNLSAKSSKGFSPQSIETEHQSSPVKGIDISIDYLMGMARLSPLQLQPFIDYLQQSFDFAFEYQPIAKYHGKYLFRNQLISPVNGIKIYYNDNGYLSDTSITLALIIPGTPLRTVSLTDIVQIVHKLDVEFRVKFTRIDVRFDDHKMRVGAYELWELVKQGDIAGSRKYKFISSGIAGDNGEIYSDAIYLGSKRRILNIYNANFLHGIPAIRWEGRFREDRATTITNYLSSIANTDYDLNLLLSYLGNKVLDIAKFVMRGLDRHQQLDRYENHEFYDSLIQDIGAINPDLLKLDPKPKLTEREFISKTFDWLNRQVFKRLNILEKVFGDSTFQYIYDLCIAQAEERITIKDKILLSASQDMLLSLTDNSFSGLLEDCSMVPQF